MSETITRHSVTCPRDIRRINRQAKNRKREKENRAAVIAWCEGKKCSCGCGSYADMAHHTSDNLYKDEIAYRDLDNCDPYYHSCHTMHHRGYERCPKCGGWMKRGSEMCYACRKITYGERIVTNQRKVRHPCLKNIGKQRCSEKNLCPHPPAKARSCAYFKERKKR